MSTGHTPASKRTNIIPKMSEKFVLCVSSSVVHNLVDWGVGMLAAYLAFLGFGNIPYL